ncbi:hypothetical protein LOK49_LG04G00346 [Camellia lanceoleosa]|uniref:Uncharacterized protein n=1 Tax=Camellia lanceoleosa TaxID=1840588 RepID=A0ACC0I4V3_9ERIC|nr:hypothetical protein LOK49_LG04G00346 [Camellia lanceoleosa]
MDQKMGESSGLLQVNCRAKGGSSGFKVAILGAAGGIGQPLAMLMKMNPLVSVLHLYDVVNAPSVTADISHMDTDAMVMADQTEQMAVTIEIHQKERLMLNTLQFNMSIPAPYVFLIRYLKAAQSDRKPKLEIVILMCTLQQLGLLSIFLIDLCLMEYEMLKFPPCFLAAGTIYTAKYTISGFKQWSKTCEWHTSYSEDQLLNVRHHVQLRTCIELYLCFI